jgi:hypothetical protein
VLGFGGWYRQWFPARRIKAIAKAGIIGAFYYIDLHLMEIGGSVLEISGIRRAFEQEQEKET